MESYEKKYKAALERAKVIIKYYKEHNRGDEASIEDLEVIFPELKESEDDKIRSAIIHFISHTPTVPKGIIGKETMLAWLEKQGEQNYLNYENINIQQKDFAPKPKETVKEAESNLTPLERKVKDILFSFHINADDGISFDGTMAIVHNLITLCQQEQKPDWSKWDDINLGKAIWYVENPAPMGVKDSMLVEWLKSLKERINGKQ